MIRLRVFAIVAIVSVLLLGTSACDGTGDIAVWDLCKDDMDCPVIMRCDKATGQCVDCLEDEDCPQGLRCVEKECVAIGEPSESEPESTEQQPPSAECDTDHDCQEGLHCCDDRTCQECCYDMHCDQDEDCVDYKCVAKKEPSGPETVSLLDFPDDTNDAAACDTGEPAGPGGEEIDITAARWLTPTKEISGTKSLAGIVSVEFGGVTKLAEGMHSVIGFYFPGYTHIEGPQDSRYSGAKADLYVVLQVVMPNFVETFLSFVHDDQWTTVPVDLQAWTDMNSVYAVLAWDQILAVWPGTAPWENANWFAAAWDPDYTVCDKVGLGEDGLPSLPVYPLPPPPAPPLPEEEQVLPHILGEFQEDYNGAFESGAHVELARLFHDAVNELYGEDQCQEYAEQVIENPVTIKILDWTGPQTWTWLIDGRSIVIDNAYEVSVDFTAQGRTTRKYIHIAEGKFLTDCGDPLPLPVEEEQQAPTTTLTVINYCGTPLYFTMAGTMYEVQGNSQLTIEADPGQYPITISIPGFDDQNRIIDLQPGSNALPITCELQPQEPAKEKECTMHTP
jgi:hypothetical protein